MFVIAVASVEEKQLKNQNKEKLTTRPSTAGLNSSGFDADGQHQQQHQKMKPKSATVFRPKLSRVQRDHSHCYYHSH